MNLPRNMMHRPEVFTRGAECASPRKRATKEDWRRPFARRGIAARLPLAMNYQAEFRCFAGCEGSFPLTQPIYRCPRCGGLLEVVHDMEALRSRGPSAWMKLFDDRYKRTLWPYGSGVWGKREWVAPSVPDDLIVSMDEGGTNLFWAERYGSQLGISDLWVKMCGNSH